MRSFLESAETQVTATTGLITWQVRRLSTLPEVALFFGNCMFPRCGCAPSDLHQEHKEHVINSLILVINHVLNIPWERSMSTLNSMQETEEDCLNSFGFKPSLILRNEK